MIPFETRSSSHIRRSNVRPSRCSPADRVATPGGHVQELVERHRGGGIVPRRGDLHEVRDRPSPVHHHRHQDERPSSCFLIHAFPVDADEPVQRTRLRSSLACVTGLHPGGGECVEHVTRGIRADGARNDAVGEGVALGSWLRSGALAEDIDHASLGTPFGTCAMIRATLESARRSGGRGWLCATEWHAEPASNATTVTLVIRIMGTPGMQHRR